MSDLDLEYLIIYENNGTPVYSRCFANMCRVALQNETLFSAFLSSLATFATASNRPQLDEIELEGTMVQVEYSEGPQLSSLLMDDMRLIFLYTQSDDYTIAAGFNAGAYERANGHDLVVAFMQSVEEFMGQHQDIDWSYVSVDTLLAFESELLRSIIHPFFTKHDTKDKCPLGDNCPLRIAIYEGQGSIFERLRNMIDEYRSKSIFRKIWLALTGSPYKVSA